jgi:hypothetical protein
MTPQHSLASLSDAALLAHVGTLAERERHVTAEVIASLAELDARRLYLGAGCSSLFTYCTESCTWLGYDGLTDASAEP